MQLQWLKAALLPLSKWSQLIRKIKATKNKIVLQIFNATFIEDINITVCDPSDFAEERNCVQFFIFFLNSTDLVHSNSDGTPAAVPTPAL